MTSIQKMPTGRYRVHYRDAAGKGQSKTLITLKEAQEFKTEIDHDKMTAALVNRQLGKRTVHEYARSWIDSIAVKPRTRDNYRRDYNTWVLPHWGNTPVQAIEKHEVRAWAMSITDVHKRSQGTRDRAIAALRSLLEFAIEHKAIKVNPAKGLKLPNLPRVVEMIFLPIPDIRALAQTSVLFPTASKGENPINQLVIEFAAFTGLRAGELWALRWMDLELDNGVVIVRRSVGLIGKDWIVGLTKNSQVRRVPLPDWLVEKLRRHHFLMGSPTGMELVFPNKDGEFTKHGDFTHRIFKPSAKAIGRPELRFHDLRHTYASLLIAEGADPKIVQRRMGHATISITFDIYGHVFPEKDDAITEALAAKYQAELRGAESGGSIVSLDGLPRAQPG